MAVEIVQRTIAGQVFDVVSFGGSGDDEKVLPIERLQKIDYKYLDEVDQWDIGDTFEEKYETAILSINIPAKQIFDTRINTVKEIYDYLTKTDDTDISAVSQRVTVVEGKVSTLEGQMEDLEPRVAANEQAIEDFNSDLHIEEIP